MIPLVGDQTGAFLASKCIRFESGTPTLAKYFTSTIYEWKPVLANDMYKDIIIESLQFLVDKKRIELNAFVIMDNHIHLTCLPARQVWQPLGIFTPSQIR